MISKYSAIIFDLDGTLIESETLWGKAFVRVMESLGVKAENDHPGQIGVSIKPNWQHVIQKYDIKTTKTLDELEVLTYAEFEKLIPYVYLKDGAIDFIEDLKENGYDIGLATSTNWTIVEKILDHFQIHYLFNAVTTGEEVASPKPSPEIFILTADKLGIDPEHCLVIEDSPSGVEAAIEAGMKVIAISSDGDEEDKLEKADLVVEDFSEITPKAIDQL
jgi:HAD superfamily hydrolase (TIGR01509 family)